MEPESSAERSFGGMVGGPVGAEVGADLGYQAASWVSDNPWAMRGASTLVGMGVNSIASRLGV